MMGVSMLVWTGNLITKPPRHHLDNSPLANHWQSKSLSFRTWGAAPHLLEQGCALNSWLRMLADKSISKSSILGQIIHVFVCGWAGMPPNCLSHYRSLANPQLSRLGPTGQSKNSVRSRPNPVWTDDWLGAVSESLHENKLISWRHSSLVKCRARVSLFFNFLYSVSPSDKSHSAQSRHHEKLV